MLLYAGAGRLDAGALGDTRRDRSPARSILRRRPIHRPPSKQRWNRPGRSGCAGRQAPRPPYTDVRNRFLYLGAGHRGALRLRGRQSTIHQVSDLQRTGTRRSPAALRFPRRSVFGAHVVMGAVPGRDGKPAEPWRSHGICRSGGNRPCQRRQRLLPLAAFGSGTVANSGRIPPSDRTRKPYVAARPPDCGVARSLAPQRRADVASADQKGRRPAHERPSVSRYRRRQSRPNLIQVPHENPLVRRSRHSRSRFLSYVHVRTVTESRAQPVDRFMHQHHARRSPA